jgi:hypothetical protein
MGAWVGSGSVGMTPAITDEHEPQPGGRAWMLARAASLSRGAWALLAGAREFWTTIRG